MGIERRESGRIDFSVPVRYRHKGNQAVFNTIGRDISGTGIGFVSSEFFPISTHLVFEAQHPVRHDFIKAVGEVMWVSKRPYSEDFSVGARFLGPPLPVN